jgi:hypothetical protein
MKAACQIIKEHNEELKDDPERLTTDFLTSIVCEPKHRINYLKKEQRKYRFNPEENWKEK